MPDDTSGPKLELWASRTDGVVVLSVRGDVDAVTAPQLTEEIAAELSGHPSGLIVDLSEVNFLASAGMAALVCGHTTAGDTRFAVVAGHIVSRPMTLLGVDLLVKIYPTLAAALAGEG